MVNCLIAFNELRVEMKKVIEVFEYAVCELLLCCFAFAFAVPDPGSFNNSVADQQVGSCNFRSFYSPFQLWRYCLYAAHYSMLSFVMLIRLFWRQ